MYRLLALALGCFMMVDVAYSQGLKLDAVTIVNITQTDTKRGTGRYKDFLVQVNQGDQLTFNIKGKGGVAVPASVFLFATNSSTPTDYVPNASTNLSWTSKPLPACNLKVRIVAYAPYGSLSVEVNRTNPADPTPNNPANANASANAGADEKMLEQLDTEELQKRARALQQELDLIKQELERRNKSNTKPSKN